VVAVRGTGRKGGSVVVDKDQGRRNCAFLYDGQQLKGTFNAARPWMAGLDAYGSAENGRGERVWVCIVCKSSDGGGEFDWRLGREGVGKSKGSELSLEHMDDH